MVARGLGELGVRIRFARRRVHKHQVCRLLWWISVVLPPLVNELTPTDEMSRHQTWNLPWNTCLGSPDVQDRHRFVLDLLLRFL